MEKENTRSYYLTNREVLLKYQKEWYNSKGKEWHKEYREANKGLFIYFILDRDLMDKTDSFSNSLLYVGETTNLKERVNLHNCATAKYGNILFRCREDGYNPILYYLNVDKYLKNEAELKELEQYYINKIRKINPDNYNKHNNNIEISRNELSAKYSRLTLQLAQENKYFKEYKADKNGYETHYLFPPTYFDLILHNRRIREEEEKRNAKVYYFNESCWTFIPNERDKDEFLMELKSKDNVCELSFYKDISNKFCEMVESYGVKTDNKFPEDVAEDMAKLKLYLYILQDNDGGNLFELHRKDKKIAYFKAKEVNGKFKIDNIRYIEKEIKDE
ncbi:MAG: GIY-YIG nuclease family protein [Clostridium sp.]|uniref:GIY-YIG nuclease family protein n=1 Tax=Clostridium TaxID=1485 RepID=UPI00232C089F|nr:MULTISPECIES: GIY-YIG nuclease family protein [Clostridium]MDB2119598.1 GIY-YIG nuclease family protein [Clostridium paraputrificum]MDU2754180.1 GIY-YIG nuclease family protein [Clostridium sp.]MDU2899909.1 GIY-YIG nuclease family protein [Clostridium sp.]MDU4426857.1 GIY-YIG nuclease family protein [Clostridium sp.]MDU7459951.1 GIY-YIG nuclease family protein [Clostridium sp.]